MPEEKCAARVHATSGFLLSETLEALESFEQAYNSLYALETTLEQLIESLRFFPPSVGRSLLLGIGYPFRSRGRYARTLEIWPPSTDQLSLAVLPSDRLLFRGAQIESPGWVEVIGALNPLETLRKYMNDRHERRKDKDFRNEAERRKFEQEERAREAELEYMQDSVIIRRIEEAKKLGASDRDIAPLLNELLNRPVRKVARFQDRGILEFVEIRRLQHNEDK
jgi:hypothetical protein